MGCNDCGGSGVGPQGPPGVVWTGPYDHTTLYKPSWIALYGDDLYICRRDNRNTPLTGLPDDPYWDLFLPGSSGSGLTLPQTLRLIGLNQ
jgi:hypothetical protein